MPGRSSSSGRSSSFSRSSSSGRSSSSRNSTRPSYSYTSPKSPAPISPPQAPIQHNVQVQQPGFFSNMWQGFGLGAGQSIAHNIFRSDPVVKHVHENTSSTAPTAPITSSASTTTESLYSKEYTQCMKDKWDDKEVCKQYVQCLKDNNNDKDLCKGFM